MYIIVYWLLQPGVRTDDIDDLIHSFIIRADAYPSPLHYKGFPKSVCTSVNNVAVHGIPDLRPLANGDIVNVDITVSILVTRLYSQLPYHQWIFKLVQ